MVRIGTSGWTYPYWKERFYPAGMAQRHWLEHYAASFDTVELNATFYRIPRADTAAGWRERTPEDFRFAVKVNRQVTHVRRLKECAEVLEWFFRELEPLAGKVAAWLLQLPPSFCPEEKLLEDFLDLLPSGRRYALELRRPDCYESAVIRVLERRGVAFCIHDYPGRPSPLLVTSDLVYVRFHGFQGRYAGHYPREALEQWARRIEDWQAQALDVLAYFNNDLEAAAVANARTLRALVGRAAEHGQRMSREGPG